MSKHNHRETRTPSGFILLLVLIFLGGCEARLDLSGVEESETHSVRRGDQFLAAAENDSTLVIVGRRGAVLTSHDAGRSWQRQQLPGETDVSLPMLVDVVSCPDGGFASLDSNRKIWLGDKEGKSWTSKTIETAEEVVDLACDADGSLWVVGSFTLILKSADKGQSWQDLSIGEDALLANIQFLPTGHAVITGEFGSVFTSSDGGASWDATGPVPNEFYSAASYFSSPEEGWVGGLQGIILHTADGGRSWQRQNTGTVSPIYGIYRNGEKLIALGDQGTVLGFEDGEWRALDVAGLGFGYLRAAAPLADGGFLVAGGNGLIRTLP